MKTRGTGEVPHERTIKLIIKGETHIVNVPLDPQERRLFVDLREELLHLRQRQAIPDAPTNLKATGQAFQNLIQWTRSSDADYYEVLHAPTPSLLDPLLQTTDVGNSALWVDRIGNTGIKKFYWVRARKRTGATSLEVGPVNATTVASATGVTPPTPPPASNILVLDKATGRVIPYTLTNPRSFRN